MIDEQYTSLIEQIFYLKENQNLSKDEINQKIKKVISDLKNESYNLGRNKGVFICKDALNKLK